MAAVQPAKPGSKKRDAEAAFSVEHQDLSWTFDEEATQTTNSQIGEQNQSAVVEKLLKTTHANTRKHVNKLVDNTQTKFSAVENDVQPMQQAYRAEMNERLQQLEGYIQESKKRDNGAFDISIRELERQVLSLDQISLCYTEREAKLTEMLECDTHIKQREQHKIRTSQCGAQVAQKQMMKATQDAQLRLDTKTFSKAHRDFFRAIQGSQCCT